MGGGPGGGRGGDMGGGPWGGRGGPGGDMGGGPGGGMWGGRGGRGGDFGGGMGRRFDPAAMLQQFDTNKNGMIDSDEAQGQRGAMIEQIIRRAGMEPNYPISISSIQDALNAKNNPDAGRSSEASASSSSTSAVLTSVKTTVLGFGNSAVLGFSLSDASSLSVGASSVSSTTSSGSTSTSTAPSAAGGGKMEDRVREMAKVKMAQFDTNHDGKIDREEMKAMSSRSQKADKNGDGVITLDELIEYDSNANGVKRAAPADSQTAPASGGTSSFSSEGKSYRFKTPTELLPSGLPNWFAQKDRDADGQVSMSEYTSEWSDAKATEFASYDLDGDGVITPQEALKAAKK